MADWEHADRVHKRKKIASWIVEIIGAKSRGAEIRIHGKDPISHQLGLIDVINFMHFRNALDEYNNIKHVSDIHNILRRNM